MKRFGAVLAAFVACVVTASTLLAQNTATTVQLPSVHRFGASTTVSVPDSGRVFVGAGRHVSRGHTAYGPNWLPPQRAGFGARQTISPITAGATIHDLSGPPSVPNSKPTWGALSDKVDPAPAEPNTRGASISLKLMGRASRTVSSSSASRPSPGIAAALAARADEKAEVQRKARAEFERGVAAEAAGNVRLAATFYRLAALHATGELRARIVERLAVVAPAANASAADR